MMRRTYFAVAMATIVGCVSPDGHSVPASLYNRVSQSFVMIAREDVEDGKSVWGSGSGFLVEDGGTNYLYTARHVVFDGDGRPPTRLYATNMKGESWTLYLRVRKFGANLGTAAWR